MSDKQRQRERVRKAAAYCADVLDSGWEEAAADQAIRYVSQATWSRLFRMRRRKRCKTLGQIAAAFLAAKQEIHSLLGSLASGALTLFGAGDTAQAFTGELVANIPLPVDAKIIAAARGIQVTGVMLCVVNGNDLTACQCFIDLALAESKAQVRKLMIAAMSDWVGLKAFPPKA
jgi:hypothetical protein